MKALLAALATAALLASAAHPALAQGNKNGWGKIETNTTGGSGKFNENSSPNSWTTVTTTGPRGQLKNNKTTNVSSETTGLPGRNR